MLRLLATALVALLVTTSAAHADSRGAGSVSDYEFPGGTDAGTLSLATSDVAVGECVFQAPHDDACVDGGACWVNDPAAVQDPSQLADTPRPHRGDHVAFMSCLTPSGDQWSRWYWSSDRASVTD